jgi:hypothetical protein
MNLSQAAMLAHHNRPLFRTRGGLLSSPGLITVLVTMPRHFPIN